MATRYEQGRDTEYAACRVLDTHGFQSRRAGASKGTWDVHGVSTRAARYIQCKRFTKRAGSYAADVAQLHAMVLPPYGSAELWIKKHGVRGWVDRILVRHSHPTDITMEELDRLGDPDGQSDRELDQTE